MIGDISDKALEQNKTRTKTPARSWGCLRLLVALSVSGVSVFLLLRDVDFDAVVRTLQRANLILLLLAVIGGVANFASRSMRWRVLFALDKVPSASRAFSALYVGLLVNVLAPTRIGELVRVYLIGESESVNKTYALGTVAIEKIIELAVALFTVGLLVTQIALPEWLVKPMQCTVIVVAAIIPILFLASQEELILRGVRTAGRFIPVLSNDWLVEQTRKGLASLRSIRDLSVASRVLAWTILAWILAILTNDLVLLAMGISVPMWAALLVLVVTQVGVAAIPSAPGQIGVFHYLVVLSLSVFAVDKEIALGYAVLLHLVVYLPMMLIGAFCLWHERMAWRKLIVIASQLRRPI